MYFVAAYFLPFIREWLFWSDEIVMDHIQRGRDGESWLVLNDAEFHVCFGGWWSGTLIDPLS